MFFKKGKGGAVGLYMEPRGRWTEKVWEPLSYSNKNMRNFNFGICLLSFGLA
jgi:hypothetical protein